MGSQRIRQDGATEQDIKNLTLKKSRYQVSDSNSKTVGSSPNLSCRVSLPLVKLWCKIREKYSPLSQKTTKHSFFPYYICIRLDFVYSLQPKLKRVREQIISQENKYRSEISVLFYEVRY